jgi:hypothetical protein
VRKLRKVKMDQPDVLCECGNSMINKEKSTPNWKVYDCVCSKCGSRSEKAAKEVMAIMLDALSPKRARKR